MKFAKLAVAAAALAIMPATAYAQDAAPAAAASVEVTQGASVTGNDGNPIGTVAQVTPDAAIVNTGSHEIPLPLNAFGKDESGLTLNITKTELDATLAQQMAEAKAALDAAMIAGAAVGTADAQPLGTIDTVEGENVVLALAGAEQKVTLGKEMFALDNNGGVIVLATLAQIQQAMPSEGKAKRMRGPAGDRRDDPKLPLANSYWRFGASPPLGPARVSSGVSNGVSLRHRRPSQRRQVDAFQRADRDGRRAGRQFPLLHDRAEHRQCRRAGPAPRHDRGHREIREDHSNAAGLCRHCRAGEGGVGR